MGDFLGLTGMFGFAICLLLLIIFAIAKKKKKPILILMAVFLSLFLIGGMWASVGSAFIMIGFVGFTVCLITLVVFLCQKREKKTALLFMAIFALLLLVGQFLPRASTDTGQNTSVSETPGPDAPVTSAPNASPTLAPATEAAPPTGTNHWDFDAKDHPEKPEPTQIVTPSPEETREAYIASCQVVSYKDLLRYPDEHVGTRIVVTVKISQIMEPGIFDDQKYYFGFTDEDGYGWYLDDEYCLIDARPDDDTKILDDDILLIYGEFTELKGFARAITGADVELPVIEFHYIKLLDE